jgi:hypothetical protein
MAPVLWRLMIGPLERRHMPLLDLFWVMLQFYLFFIWIWLLISIFGDIFRSDDMGGGAKAFWILFVVVLPILGVLIYVIARGHGMAERSARDAAAAEDATRAYIQEAAGSTSSADELAKLARLRDQGVLSNEEFEAQKAALLA